MANDELLNILQIQGQEFLNSFLPNPNQKKRKRAGDVGSLKNKFSKVTQNEESEEEWLGFSRHSLILGENNSPEESSGENGDEG